MATGASTGADETGRPACLRFLIRHEHGSGQENQGSGYLANHSPCPTESGANSLTLLCRCASLRRFSSSDDSFGQSIVGQLVDLADEAERHFVDVIAH
jgi:hypothetical protein